MEAADTEHRNARPAADRLKDRNALTAEATEDQNEVLGAGRRAIVPGLRGTTGTGIGTDPIAVDDSLTASGYLTDSHIIATSGSTLVL